MRKFAAIAFIIIWYNGYSQFAVTKTFDEPKYFSLCSGRIIFDSLGYFFKEHGCEGASTVSLGKYTITGNKINLHYLPHDSLTLIRNIVYYDERPTDSTIYIRFFDRYLDTISLAFIEYANDKERNDVAWYTNKKAAELKYANAALLFWRLNDLYNLPLKDSIIQIPLTSKSMDIYFGLPEVYFIYNHYTEEPAKERITEMLFINRGLYSMDGKEKYYTLQ